MGPIYDFRITMIFGGILNLEILILLKVLITLCTMFSMLSFVLFVRKTMYHGGRLLLLTRV